MTIEVHSKNRFARLAPAAVVVAAVITMLSSCNLLNQTSIVKPATIDACVNGFSSAYSNGSYSILYQYFSTNATMYNQIKPSSYWDSTPFYSGYHPQALTGVTDTSTTTVNATFANDNGSYAFNATLEQNNGYWYMLSLTVNTPSPFTID